MSNQAKSPAFILTQAITMRTGAPQAIGIALVKGTTRDFCLLRYSTKRPTDIGIVH